MADKSRTNLTNLRPLASFLLWFGNTANPKRGPASAPATCAAQPTRPQPRRAGIGREATSALAKSSTAPSRQPA